MHATVYIFHVKTGFLNKIKNLFKLINHSYMM